MTMTIACLPGDGIGPEVTAQALRVLAQLPLEVDRRRAAVRRRRDRRGRRAAARRRRSPPAGRGRRAPRRGRRPALGRRRRPARAGAARPAQGARRLREPAARAHGDVDLLIVRELVGGLYFGARGVRDDGTVFDTCEYHPSQVERVARRAFELARARRGSLRLGRQGERARHVAALAPRRHRARRRLSRRRAAARARRQLRDGGRRSPRRRSTSSSTENMFGDILSRRRGAA